MGVFLGIDVGTSGTKTLAVSEDGNVLASSTVEYDLQTPQPGWTEQHPETWWDAVIHTVQHVVEQGQVQPADVAGIGLSGQMHGSVFLDANRDVIRPALLWNDQRTATQCDEIEQRAGGRRALIDLVANPALTGFTAPKILWLRENEPQNYDRTAQVLLPKDYIRYRLTEEFATEVSDASGTLLLDVKNRCWCEPLLELLEIDRSLLPKVYESEEVTGALTGAAAELLGLRAGIPVVGGGGDQAAGAVGNGITQRGAISAAMGTSGVVFAHSDEVQIDPEGRVHTFCHAVRDKWHVMGVVLSAGGSLQWFRNELADTEKAAAKLLDTDPYELMTQQAEAATSGCDGLFFLPYLTGERTPHGDPFARGAFIGLSRHHGRKHLIRAVIEGATFAMRDSLEIIREMQIPVEEIRLSGGGAHSAFWRQVQANVYGQDVCRINVEQGPAYGAALLAAAGTGAYKDVVEACAATIRVVDQTPVDLQAAQVYDRAFPIYRKLYRSLKQDFREIAEMVGG
jgi:xylulokinase